MTRIQLPRGEWFYDETRRLGRPGGFGEVFEGRSARDEIVAVKRLKVTAGEAAHRELKIADELTERSFEHVLAVLDAGEDPDTGLYFVVMPRADGTLADDLAARGVLPSVEAAAVLLEIASGLAEVPNIVHRDLKPANVLRHEGLWKIADFGIAKFIEDATSLNTVKGMLTPQFGAPEQWRGERSDAATDVYALSCIAYVLLTGEPPFGGPTMADYQHQHLTTSPRPLPDAVDARLRSIVTAGLRKSQAGRPRTRRVIEILRDVTSHPPAATPAGVEALRAVNAIEAERLSRAEAEESRLRHEAAAREALVQGAEEAIGGIRERLRQVILKNGPETKDVSRDFHVGRRPALQFVLGTAELRFESQGATPPNATFPASKWEVVAVGLIQVTQRAPDDWQHGATLWYMRRQPEDEFRWFEVSYKRNALMRGPLVGPFPIQALGNRIFEEADLAASPAMHSIEIESGPTLIDDEDLDKFVERWVARFADAYRGRLRPF